MKENLGKISRFDRTCARERRGEVKMGSRKPVGCRLGFKALFLAERRIRKVLLIRWNGKVSK